MEGRARATWDAAAQTGSDHVLGRPEHALEQLEALFRDVGAEPHGDGVCLELGCGAGRMTVEIAKRWPRVVAADVSPAMLERARLALAAAGATNVVLTLAGRDTLDDVGAASVDTVVCFGVFQHLSSRSACQRIVVEIGRVLRPGGEAFVQLPVLAEGPRARLWRMFRFAGLRILGVSPGYYGVRLTRREWARAFARAELRVEAEVERDDDPTLISRYPHAHDTRIRLRRG